MRWVQDAYFSASWFALLGKTGVDEIEYAAQSPASAYLLPLSLHLAPALFSPAQREVLEHPRAEQGRLVAAQE